MSPLSSTWAGENDGFRYIVGADTFTLERQDSSLGVEPIELSVSWKWENLPWTREKLASQKTVWDIGATGLLDYTRPALSEVRRWSVPAVCRRRRASHALQHRKGLSRVEHLPPGKAVTVIQ